MVTQTSEDEWRGEAPRRTGDAHGGARRGRWRPISAGALSVFAGRRESGLPVGGNTRIYHRANERMRNSYCHAHAPEAVESKKELLCTSGPAKVTDWETRIPVWKNAWPR